MTFVSSQSTEERFWSKVDQTEGCWLWTASVNKDGYGWFRLSSSPRPGVTIFAHQYLAGKAAPGFEWDHLCRTRRCVRPDHLEQVPHLENVRRVPAYSRGNAEKTHCKRGHEFNEKNTQVRKSGARQCRACNNQRRREARQVN